MNDNLPKSQKILFKVTDPISRCAIRKKQNRDKRFCVTLGEILNIGGVDIETLRTIPIDNRGGEITENQHIAKYNWGQLLDLRITQVCRAGSRFTKGCLCVQLYEDTIETMRWAMNNGAIALVTREQIEGLPCIVVDNPEAIYARICAYFRSLSDTEITAVAGSIGKTTTKRMMNCVFSTQFNTFNDPENENQLDCVGYIAQHIPSGVVRMVQEVSEDTPGYMAMMSQVTRPDSVIFTAVDLSHIQQYGSKEKIYDEVCSILNNLKEGGSIVVNMDDEYLTSKVMSEQRNVIRISPHNTEADYYSSKEIVTAKGILFDYVEKSTGETGSILLNNSFAIHNVVAALSCIATARSKGETFDNIKKGFAKYRPCGIRQNIYTTNDGVTLYVDCYNAVAKSMYSAFETIGSINVDGQKIAVIGDIEEAGEKSKKIHQQVLEHATSGVFDKVITYGPKFHEVFVESGINNKKIQSYVSKDEIAEILKTECKKGDLVLFKASRKSALETIIARLWKWSYYNNMVSYYWPKFSWRIKTILS